ncbi:hypothetical protein DFQ27_002337 [Actinomortierella ambigua]|uniref:Peroxisomal membrane protein PEX14 n=1 Tax=Actinomortierella ambigua TaxID=1343610 RepID=A0A9P6Q9K5_9FUNG|nr:hypothetical protein DFQ27_002337 [Actinomortierella ambigua]
MSSTDSSASPQEPPAAPTMTAPVSPATDATSGQALTADQRSQRRGELLKRQREAREKAQQLAQAARANANGAGATSSSAAAAPPTTPTTTTTTTTSATTNTATTTPAAGTTTTITPSSAPADVPVRENLVQQAIAFLSSPNVRSADEAKKTQFLEKKGLTTKEIEIARSRISAGAGSSAPANTTVTTTAAPATQTSHAGTGGAGGAAAGPVPPPVPPRTYASQLYPTQVPPPQQQMAYMMPQQQQVAPVDPLAFRRKLIVALLVSGGITALTGIVVQKLLYPMVRGITGARRTMAVAQTELLKKLKERLAGYKDYLQSLRLGDSYSRRRIQKASDNNEESTKKTTIEEVNEDGTPVDTQAVTTTTTATTTTTKSTIMTLPSTMEQLDKFSETLERHSKSMTFEELKAVRSITQDLAEYITKETYSLTSSLAYPTSRYYGYNTAGAAAANSGKGGLNDPTTPEAALRSEIRSLKGLLLNWRNFPTTKESNALTPPNGVPSLVQAQ